MILIMGSSPLQLQKHQPTREQAEKYVDDYMTRTISKTDANDLLYYVNASRKLQPGTETLIDHGTRTLDQLR